MAYTVEATHFVRTLNSAISAFSSRPYKITE